MLGFLKKKRSVVLVLGGGSARGLAHIGVLKILEREKIPIHMIVGTSMGSLIGAAYSLGISTLAMEVDAYSFTANKLLDPTIPTMGLLAGGKPAACSRRAWRRHKGYHAEIRFGESRGRFGKDR